LNTATNWGISMIIKLRTSLLLLLIVLLAQCAQFQFYDYRTVKSSSQRIGVVADRLIGYNRLEVISFPNESSPVLHVYLTKMISRTVKYKTDSHREEIYKKQVSNLEAFLDEYGGFWVGFHGFMFILAGKLWLPYAAVTTWIGTTMVDPQPEFEYHLVPRSEETEVSYRENMLSIPAQGESLLIDESRTIQTNNNGHATIRVDPSQFDTGITIRHVATDNTYLVRREKKERTIRADWVKTVKLLNLAIGWAQTLAKLVNTAIAGAGSHVMVLTIVVHIASGLVINFAIEKLGTTTEQYYKWIVIVLKQSSERSY